MVVRRAQPTPLSATEPDDSCPPGLSGDTTQHGANALASRQRTADGGASARPPAFPFDPAIRFARGMAVAGAILFFWSAAFCLAWLVVPYVCWREPNAALRRRRMQRLVAAAWRWFLRQLEQATLYRCRYQGGPPPEGACVIVANHPSLLDVTAIIARVPHACCVVKSGLVASPLVGRLLRACGHVAAGDGSLMGGAAVLDAVRQRLDEGFPVLIFPEGTRSPPHGLRRFRRGAFEVAKRAGVPLVPVFLRCDPPALGKGAPVWRHPRRCPTLTVHMGAPIDTNVGDPLSLCKNLEQDFRSRLHVEASLGEYRS